MTTSRKPSPPFGDIEMPHPTASEPLGDVEAQPMTVRLADLWSDFVRAAEETRDQDGRKKPGSAVPILDDMKGILQWD
ncbi:MAG TPA: hypothetical protein VGN73_10950 [Gemmatimonadaceae bacterium]|jgi:hypothetical protein|nr:hypothetical protein [Gemmatimonadaceae bacterium]